MNCAYIGELYCYKIPYTDKSFQLIRKSVQHFILCFICHFFSLPNSFYIHIYFSAYRLLCCMSKRMSIHIPATWYSYPLVFSFFFFFSLGRFFSVGLSASLLICMIQFAFFHSFLSLTCIEFVIIPSSHHHHYKLPWIWLIFIFFKKGLLKIYAWKNTYTHT